MNAVDYLLLVGEADGGEPRKPGPEDTVLLALIVIIGAMLYTILW